MKKLAKAMVIPVRQRTQYTCVPCSLSMCLRALGMDWITEDIVNDVMGARPMKGATWEAVINAAQHFGKRATLTAPCTIEQMKEWTDQGLPLMIAWNPEGRDWSHASVVFHVCNTHVWVADPNIPDPNEVVRKVEFKDFYNKWYEKHTNYLVRRPCVVISHEISEAGTQVPYPNMRMAMDKQSNADLDRRFSITIQHLNKLLSKVENSWKWSKKIDNENVREKAVGITLKKLQDAIDFHDLMTNADLKNLYRAIERQGSLGKTAHSDYMSKQNIRDALRMCQDLVLWVDGENMEDWVEDKLSVIRAALSDVHRFYTNGKWDIGKEKITLWREASIRVADRYVAGLDKTAGGDWFMERGRGKDPKKLFRDLRESAFEEYALDARQDAAEYGEEWEYEGYSGTMYEKDSFKIVSNDPKPLSFFNSRNLRQEYGENDKWGPAFAAPYSRREGGAIEGWVFWGWASS